MFIRYDVNYAALTNTTANMATIMNDLVGAMNGSIATPSGFNAVACNTATSRIVGGPITSIMLDDGTTPAYVAATFNTNVASTLLVTKKHPAYNSANSYTPSTYTMIGAESASFGFKFRTGQTTGTTAMYPYQAITGTNYWLDNTNNSALLPSNIARIHVYASKHWFIVQMINTSGKVYTGCSLDFESTIEDVYFFKQNAYAVPNVAFASVLESTIAGNAAASTDRILLGRCYYPDVSGNLYTALPPSGVANNVNNVKTSTVQGAYTINPAPTEMMYQNYADGYTGPQNKLTPVFVEGYGYAGWSTPSAKVRKVSEFYRTTDNFLANGDQVTIGGVNYRTIIMHKTLNASYTTNNLITDAQATRNACYLVPETIGGV